MTEAAEVRTAVIDLGSNSFRLVVFTAEPGSWWKRTDEIHETVRIGEGLAASGRLGAEPSRRALRTLELYAHFIRTLGLDGDGAVRAVATSAIRDAANGPAFVAEAELESGLSIRILSPAEEARYGYLAAINSTTLEDGLVLDLGGGSVQLVRVKGREERDSESWPLGAVRMTERFLATDEPADKKALRALRTYALRKLDGTAWASSGKGGRLVGIGGTVRNLAAAAMRRAEMPADAGGVQGFVLTRDALDALVEELASRPPSKRAAPGIKPGRAEIILAGAVVVQAVLEAGGFDGVEVTEAGLREGVFFESHLPSPHRFEDVRRASVLNLAAQYEYDLTHVRHVATLSLAMFDALAEAGVGDGGSPAERELLWAAAMLHDVGMAVDYDDHHKHSRYLILGAGLPGFAPRELALIAQIARYHRKGSPELGELAPLMDKGDDALLVRCSALLRLAEHLERGRDQVVRDVRMRAQNGSVELKLRAGDDDPAIARWGAERQADLFSAAFGRELVVK